MAREIVDHAAALLRDDADAAVPVPRLYAELEAALGPQPGGAMRLCERLRRERDRFLVIERQLADWSGRLDEDEDRAFREALRLAGVETEPRVMLRTEPRSDAATLLGPSSPYAGARGALERLRASLAGLIDDTDPEDGAQDELLEALDRAAELRRTLRGLERDDLAVPHDPSDATKSADHQSSSRSSASRR